MKNFKMLRTTVLLAATTLVAAAGFGQTTTWKIDPVHSGIEFQIKHLGVSTVRGSFSKPAGTIHLDEKDITKSSVEASFEAGSVNTNDSGRDNHLKSAEFFNVAQFPTITFKSTSLSKQDGKLKMTGDLTIAGVTKPVTLTLDGPAPPQKGMHDTIVSGFSATGTLSRKEFNFGQKYGPPMLGDDVSFTIDIEMDKQ